jgi:hypothetical protein
MFRKKVVISQSWGGLGDNLQFSTLPELYSKNGYDVFISTINAYRNPEIYDLVWKSNPFVKGISDEPPNAGECRGVYGNTGNFITNIEQAHGLYNGYRIYPSVYYQPTVIPELANCLLYDATSISTTPTDNQIETSFNHVFAMHPTLKIKKIEFSRVANRNLPYFNHEVYTINSIHEMCDAIYSCRVFLTVLSGASCLASALKQDNPTPTIYTFHDRIYDNTIGYKFKNNNHLTFTESN